ncbi:FecR domain-containing protein [Vibrio gigantis]|uniref:FecR domain-containing protein n=1 Tax=Vibrio gigantis TaxID=296199 RepID=UPI001EFA9882|nr:FecR domain-containing protein [Vibrio gigantis]ULN65873.1 FecR domain-containing protein [Vibrio gigantis]
MQQLPPETIEQASVWMARLWADDATQQDHDSFECWRLAHPNNALAWQKLELLQSKFCAIPQGKISKQVLTRKPPRVSRREFLSISTLSFVALGSGMAIYRPTPTGTEYSTATGEIRSMTLFDGTQLTINTDSKLFVDFDNHQRDIHIERGEVMITNTHHRSPLTVSTSQGLVLPIGTQFSIREHIDTTQVSVYEGEVEIQPMLGMGKPHLFAGQTAHFNRRTVSQPNQTQDSDMLWLEHKIMAEATQLKTFINELGRYRRGIINVDASAAALKLTGVFSTKEIDKTLHNISQILPVRIHYRTPLWVTITAI